jgi:hypothetical protein
MTPEGSSSLSEICMRISDRARITTEPMDQQSVEGYFV